MKNHIQTLGQKIKSSIIIPDRSHLIFTFILICTISSSGQQKMYWTSGEGDIFRANLDGTNTELLIDGMMEEPNDIALDLNSEKFYWTDESTQEIRRANLDGSGNELVISAANELQFIALDLSAGKMYWTADGGPNEVRRANLDGTGNEQLILLAGMGDGPTGIALDIPGNKIYFADQNTNSIMRSDLDGSNLITLIPGLSEPQAVALDLTGGKIYWSDEAEEHIARANLDGTGMEEVIDMLSEPQDIALDVANGHIYWTEGNGGVITRANLDGTNPVDLIMDDPQGLALDLRPINVVPTVGEWALILIGLSLLILGVVAVKSHSTSVRIYSN